jgi:hypothetical protein
MFRKNFGKWGMFRKLHLIPHKQKNYCNECTTFAFPIHFKYFALAAFNCNSLCGNGYAGAFLSFTSKKLPQ